MKRPRKTVMLGVLAPATDRISITRMKISNLREGDGWFKVLQTSRKTQFARMTLAPGKSSGPKGNEHPRSEQVLYVIEGEILAEVGDEKTTLRKGDAVIVPAGKPHRFTNHGGSTAITFNVYSPPAYERFEEE